MKNFFVVLFAGVCALVLGIVISYVSNDISKRPINFTALGSIAASFIAAPADGTTISGMKRILRFSATQEEDPLNTTLFGLPASDNKQITAKAYIVKDLSNTKSLPPMVKNADVLLPIASLTKLVTAHVADRLIPADSHISIDANIISAYGNTAGFKSGETLTAGDLMYPLLMVSSNEAAEALAQTYGRHAFITAMNDFVQSIGAYRTNFSDPSGLSPHNVSTVNDLALILDWLHTNDPAVIAITQLKSKTIRGYIFENPTHFLSWSNYAGGKNGYTTEANRTAASLFTVGKQKEMYAVVVLGSDYRDGDVINLLGKI